MPLTHWGQVTHICVSRLTITGSDNGLSPGRRQAIIWTNAGILLTGPLGTNFSENFIEILKFSFTKMRLKSVVCEIAAILSRPQCVKITLRAVVIYITWIHWKAIIQLLQNKAQQNCVSMLWIWCIKNPRAKVSFVSLLTTENQKPPWCQLSHQRRHCRSPNNNFQCHKWWQS